MKRTNSPIFFWSFRWSIVISVSIAIFWLYCWQSYGLVPTVSVYWLIGQPYYDLPFSMSHWWDVLLGPVYAYVLVRCFTNKIINDNNAHIYSIQGLYLGALTGIGSMFLGLVVSIIVGLILCVGFGLLVSSIIERYEKGKDDKDNINHQDVGLLFALIFAVSFGLIIGLLNGLIISLIVGLAMALIGYLLLKKIFFSKKLLIN